MSMKWTVLTDNRTIDPQLETEHGLAILLETKGYRMLLDTGASDLLLRNARTLGIDLSDVDYVFVSHGHADHAGGLRHLLGVNAKARVIVAPEALKGRFFSRRKQLHEITPVWPNDIEERLLDPASLPEGIHVIAHIPQIHPTPRGNHLLQVMDKEGHLVADDFCHELALYADGLLFTGCAHSGLENILAACPWPVHTVVGGFHLLDGMESEDSLEALAHRLLTSYPDTQFYTSHCTGDQTFALLKCIMGSHLHAFSCGSRVENHTPMSIQEFIQNYREAFGNKAPLPLLFSYSDTPIAPTERIGGCFFKGLNEARNGTPVSLSADVIGCGGGKLYTGFSDMPERVPAFVSLKEKYKKTPEMVKDYVEALQIRRSEKPYLNFIRIDQADSFESTEGVLFYATPDMLSGLCGWAFYDTNAPDAVVSQFGSGCSTVVSMTIAENARQGHRCFLGAFDPSVRPWFGKDELSFTIPFSRFVSMMDNMRDCFLFDAHAWQKVKARLEE